MNCSVLKVLCWHAWKSVSQNGFPVVVDIVPTVDFLEENPVVATVCKDTGMLSLRVCGAFWRGVEAEIPEFYDPNDESEILTSLPLHPAIVPTLTRFTATCDDLQTAFDSAGLEAVLVRCWAIPRFVSLGVTCHACMLAAI